MAWAGRGRGPGGNGFGRGSSRPTRRPQDFPPLGDPDSDPYDASESVGVEPAKRPRSGSGSDSSGNGSQRAGGDSSRGGGGGGRGGGRGGRGNGMGGDGDRRGARRGPRFDRNEKFDLVNSLSGVTIVGGTKKGKAGTPMRLLTNFFPLRKKPTWCLYNYRVDFKPDEDRTPIKKALLKAHSSSLGAYIFDGSTMWTAHRLSPEPMGLTSIREPDNEKIEITVRLVQEMAPGDVTYLQFYNIIVRKCLQMLGFEEIGRHFYDRNNTIPMPQQRLELWPGYVTTMRNYEAGVMLCVDVTHRVLRLDNALEGFADGRGYNRAQAEEMIGSIVMTHYNRKTYKIDDIDWTKTPNSRFEMRGEEITFAQYFRDKYAVNIMDLGQPLLVSRPKKRDMHRGQTGPILLVPELCQMTGLTDQLRSNFNIMKALAQHLHQPPNARMDNIRNFMRRLKDKKEIKEELTRWGLEFDSNLAQVDGRKLPIENILMKNTTGAVETVEPDPTKADWTMAFRNKQMYHSKPLSKWVLIVGQRDASGVDNLIRTMSRVSGAMGFTIHQPMEIKRLHDTRAGDYQNAIKQLIEGHRGDIELFFVILPNNKTEIYSAVKKRCCIDYGVASQCFLGKTLNNKGLMSVATKVVIQMNAKLGGEPWAVSNPLKSSNPMVIGFDVYHCGKRKGPSIGAMVATTNQEFSKYFSTVSYHNTNEELSANLCTDITKCIQAFRSKNNNILPGRVIMYRDGVGEGQLGYVYNTELGQIKTALLGLYHSAQASPPKFSLIVVTKKINARIALLNPRSQQCTNPAAGTVVDDVITLPERYDFYLIAQNANQGTVSPTSYNVLWDQQGLDPDKIQRFTYKLTHLYYNWSGTVAVPATCQYAHKLAYLTGMALGSESSERLAHQLFYL